MRRGGTDRAVQRGAGDRRRGRARVPGRPHRRAGDDRVRHDGRPTGGRLSATVTTSADDPAPPGEVDGHAAAITEPFETLFGGDVTDVEQKLTPSRTARSCVRSSSPATRPRGPSRRGSTSGSTRSRSSTRPTRTSSYTLLLDDAAVLDHLPGRGGAGRRPLAGHPPHLLRREHPGRDRDPPALPVTVSAGTVRARVRPVGRGGRSGGTSTTTRSCGTTPAPGT